MKLRSCLTLLVLLFISFSINAQKGQAIVHAGVNFTRVSLTNGGKYDASDILTTFQFGIKGDYHLVELLIEEGAPINGSPSQPPIFTAIYPDILRLLLECGANVHAKDSHGRTAIQWARERGAQNEIIELLIRFGARE